MCGKWLKGIKKHKYNCVRKFKKSVVLFVLPSILRFSWFKSKPLQRIKKKTKFHIDPSKRPRFHRFIYNRKRINPKRSIDSLKSFKNVYLSFLTISLMSLTTFQSLWFTTIGSFSGAKPFQSVKSSVKNLQFSLNTFNSLQLFFDFTNLNLSLFRLYLERIKKQLKKTQWKIKKENILYLLQFNIPILVWSTSGQF